MNNETDQAMILLHQLWNQRRQNLWIFAELLIVGFFLWMVVDPVFVLTANRLIDQGGDVRGMYVFGLYQYDTSFGQYDAAQDSAPVMRRHYLSIVRALKDCPEVESVAITTNGGFPNSQSWNGMMLYGADSTRLHVQCYEFVSLEGSDLPHTCGMRDARTNRRIALPADFAARGQIAISRRTAIALCGTPDAVGRTVYTDSRLTQPCQVAAVFHDYKNYTSEQPYPLAVIATPDLSTSPYMGLTYPVVLRLRPEADARAFESRFAREVAPSLPRGNFFASTLQTFDSYSRQQALVSGITGKLRLQYALGGFALLCIFLGMTGTFYVRTRTRRAEIGLLCALGASRASVVRRFLLEAWVLVTVAYALSLIAVAHYAFISGFAESLRAAGDAAYLLAPDPAYVQNRPWAHFCLVSVLVYVLLLLTALAGTCLPAGRAARIGPAAALREE